MRATFQRRLGEQWALLTKFGWLVCVVVLSVTLTSFIVGCFTTVWDNDEAHHARMSLGFYMAGKRVPHNPMAATKNVPWDQFYYTEVLWPLLLSKLWILAGQPSHILAQLYQAIWFFALLIGLYYLSRLYYDPWESLLAIVLTISIPMVPVFGTLFFLDVPTMALTVWALYAAHKLERWPWVFVLGLLMGGIYLTKRLNIAFFPGIALIGLLTARGQWRKRLAKLAAVAVVAAVPIIIDLDYRSEHFNSLLLNKHKTLKAYSYLVDHRTAVVKEEGRATDFYVSDSLLRWKDALLHIGPFLPLALLLYLISHHYERRDVIFMGLAALYAVSFILFSLYSRTVMTVPRYYLPSFVLITVPAAKELKKLWRRHFGRIILLICGILAIVQLALVLNEIHKRRQLPADMAEAYKFICKSTPDDGKVFLCNGYGLELHTGRISTTRSIVPQIFFQPSTSWETRTQVLEELNIGYIICRQECIYDDRKEQVIWNASGGMPLSFFEDLEQSTNYELIFKNNSVTIWKVNHVSNYSP